MTHPQPSGRRGRTLLALALLGTGSAWAGPLPPTQHQGAVAYLSGGIGHDEAQAFQKAAEQWPVMLEFAVKERGAKRDAFLANVSVQITGARHAVLLDTVSDGPFVLARLQPGHYQVTARFDGKTMTRTLDVGPKGTARALFVWPQAAEMAAR